VTTQRGDLLRVLFLLLDDTIGPVMLLVTDKVAPFHIRIVGLYGHDETVTTLLKHEDAAFRWIEDVVDDLGIDLIVDMVASFPPPDLDGIEFDDLNEWAAAAFNKIIRSGRLLTL
jgi:hypothetical protein